LLALSINIFIFANISLWKLFILPSMLEHAFAYLKKHWLIAVGVVVGAVAGYLYWLFIGCSSGTCPITSSPIMSTIWGMLLGGSLFNIVEKKEIKSND
jgi:hypothetical protein